MGTAESSRRTRELSESDRAIDSQPEDTRQRRETAEPEKVPSRQVGRSGRGLAGEVMPCDQRDEKKGRGNMYPQHRERADVANRPGRVNDPGDQHDRCQTCQDQRQSSLGIAPGQTSLSNPRLPGSEQQNGKTHGTVKGDDEIARGLGSDGLTGQTRGESAEQQCQQGQIGATSAEVTARSSRGVSLCHNNGNNIGYSTGLKL